MFNPYILLAAVALLIGSYFAGHHKGYAEADQRAKVAELQAALAAAQQDLSAQRIAAELNRQAAQINEREAAAAQQRVSEYEAELAKRGDAGRCSISNDDLGWLSKRGSPADHKKPARH